MTISKGLVFDIKRFALHDGDGLRTTIFLKGCPLRCKWCQNPEGIDPIRRPIYMSSKCIHCKSCVSKNIYYDQRPHFIGNNIDKEIEICPTNAIGYDSYYISEDDLLKEIQKDEVFYLHNGGVTFSGGEPFYQHQFLIQMLKRCKQLGYSTAIETTLFVKKEILKEALPYIDIIYADFKIFDNKKHIDATLVSNKLIKENFQYLLTSKYKDKVIVRTPLIPTMTAYDNNLKEISIFLYNLYPNVKYELLNYNPLAPSKYQNVYFDYGLDKEYKKYTKEEMEHFNNIIKY